MLGKLKDFVTGMPPYNENFDFGRYPECVWYFILLRCDAKTVLAASKTCSTLCRLVDNDFWMEWCSHHNVTLPPLHWRQFCLAYILGEDSESAPTESSPGTSGSAKATTPPPEPEDNVQLHEDGDEWMEHMEDLSDTEDDDIPGSSHAVPAEPLPDYSKIPHRFNYKKIALLNPYYRNLAPELKAEDTIDSINRSGTMRLSGRGDGIRIEQSPPVYCEVDERIERCFATSFGWCSKVFEVDLVKAGVETWVLDRIRPRIIVRELANCRRDCGAEYELQAVLQKPGEIPASSYKPNPRSKTVTKRWEQWQGGVEWSTMEIVFEKYPIGVRSLMVMSRGKDTQFWAGHYGSKFANMEVIIEFPEECKFFGATEIADPALELEGPPGGRRLPFRSLRVPLFRRHDD